MIEETWFGQMAEIHEMHKQRRQLEVLVGTNAHRKASQLNGRLSEKGKENQANIAILKLAPQVASRETPIKLYGPPLHTHTHPTDAQKKASDVSPKRKERNTNFKRYVINLMYR